MDDKYRAMALMRANWSGLDAHREDEQVVSGYQFNTELQVHICFRNIWQNAADKNKVSASIYSSLIWFKDTLKKSEDSRHIVDANYKRVKSIFSTTINTLKWLQKHPGALKTMKICENPQCKSGHTCFFRVYPNDKYCCNVCVAVAKRIRSEQRDRENQRPPKEYKRDQLSRDRMSDSARLRWARERGKG
jgi:hypothetical protein